MKKSPNTVYKFSGGKKRKLFLTSTVPMQCAISLGVQNTLDILKITDKGENIIYLDYMDDGTQRILTMCFKQVSFFSTVVYTLYINVKSNYADDRNKAYSFFPNWWRKMSSKLCCLQSTDHLEF